MITLLLLAATVWSFEHLPLGLSDRNKTVLWPGCGGRAVWNLHKKTCDRCSSLWKGGDVVAASRLALRWMFDLPRTGCARRNNPRIYVARTSINRVIVAWKLCRYYLVNDWA